MRILEAIAISVCLLASGAKSQTSSDPGAIRITRSAAQPSQPAPTDHFTGAVRIDSSFQATAPARLSGARVTFEPGARTAWHTHPLGQLLIVTAGTGRVQRWGDAVDEIRQGDVVWIPAGAEALARSRAQQLDGAHRHRRSARRQNRRLDGEGQRRAVRRVRCAAQTAPANAGARPRPSQAAIGDFAPKLAELTDNVLYGDIWERPELSKRDRSLITVAALIALNRPDQLRSHLRIARQNGVTQEELIETITHLAFYAGWPNAVTAIGVAREVFGKR